MTVRGPMTALQTRIVDPILSQFALGYRMPGLVGETLFPRVPVALTGGQVLMFGKEHFMTYATRRAWGSDTARAAFGYAGVPYALLEDLIEVPLPREMIRDASVMPGIDLGTIGQGMAMDIVLLALERDQAEIALNAGNYGANTEALAGVAKWSNAACDPVPQINAAREAVRQSIGRYPNTMLLGPAAFAALRDNQTMRTHFQFTSAASITTDMIQAYFKLDKVVSAEAITSDDGGNFTDIWGNNAVLAYVGLGPITQATPSFAMTYMMTGHPVAEMPYYDNRAKSWVYGATIERVPVQTALGAGYLIQNPA